MKCKTVYYFELNKRLDTHSNPHTLHLHVVRTCKAPWYMLHCAHCTVSNFMTISFTCVTVKVRKSENLWCNLSVNFMHCIQLYICESEFRYCVLYLDLLVTVLLKISGISREFYVREGISTLVLCAPYCARP